MKTREQVISSMCHTWRHDFGLLEKEEKLSIWNSMAQIFDNDIVPNMVFKDIIDARKYMIEDDLILLESFDDGTEIGELIKILLQLYSYRAHISADLIDCLKEEMIGYADYIRENYEYSEKVVVEKRKVKEWNLKY